MNDEPCKFKPETTNGGHCFADCSCGWSGGVYVNRTAAGLAWRAHVICHTPLPPLAPVVLFGPPAGGQEEQR